VLPLQFKDGQNLATFKLTGRELYDIEGIDGDLEPGGDIQITARSDDSKTTRFAVRSRIDTRIEVDYYRNGGILPTVLRQMMSA
jgi:aconitate hydratase